MKRFVPSVLVGGLVAAVLLAGCGGGGGGGNSGGGGGNGGGSNAVTLTGTVEKMSPSSWVPAAGIIVTLGAHQAVTNASGVFTITLPAGATVKSLFPSPTQDLTPPANYVLSLENPNGPDGQPPVPIFAVQYPKDSINSYPAEAVPGDWNVWWGNTTDFGTFRVQ